MTSAPWPTPNWPEGVPHEVADYDKPLFDLLDEAARDYPNQVYTVFNDATRTFAQVKDTADRIANFLHAKGIRKGDRVAIFLPNLPHYPAIYFGIPKAHHRKGRPWHGCGNVGDLQRQILSSLAERVPGRPAG